MTALRLVVTGTGRCGTQRLAQVLTRAGLDCSHEAVWTPAGTLAPIAPAESSWLAVPHLDHVHCPVVLTYREPELVVGSFLATEFFTHPDHAPYRTYALDRVPGLRRVLDESGPRVAAEHWYRWFNGRALERADLAMHVAHPPIGALAALTGLDEGALAAADAAVGVVDSRPRVEVHRWQLWPSTIDVFRALERAAS